MRRRLIPERTRRQEVIKYQIKVKSTSAWRKTRADGEGGLDLGIPLGRAVEIGED